MSARLMVIAAVALTIGTSVTAEPAKTPASDTSRPASRPAEVVLASADQAGARETAPAQAAVPAKRPRVARVTTCRCGDPQAQQDQ